MSAERTRSSLVKDVLDRSLVFVSGKGGVGKTVVSLAIAMVRASQGARTLWVTFEDPTRSRGETKQISPDLWHLNCDATLAFEEYATLKIGAGPLARLFIQNKLVRYLAKASPGIHELVLLGKVWFERTRYEYVIMDMPATGHGLAMFQSTKNFSALFSGGPIHKDAHAMLETFADPAVTGQLIVALPEEMPLRESLELNDLLLEIFPQNQPAFVANRLFPKTGETLATTPDKWPSPLATSMLDYVIKRTVLENFNMRIWRDLNIDYGEINFIPPPDNNSHEIISAAIAGQLTTKGYM
ncbi:MAG: ArsA family ATPase [Bdellovibrionota bacterium]